MSHQSFPRTAAIALSAPVFALGTLIHATPASAANPLQCGTNVTDYTDPATPGGTVPFTLTADIDTDASKVASVQFTSEVVGQKGNTTLYSAVVTPTSSAPVTATGGLWYYESPAGSNANKTGVATLVTTVTRAEGTYITTFAMDPVCNPGNLLRPTNVFQATGPRTVVFVATGQTTGVPGQPTKFTMDRAAS
ncbi:hypothetical protein LKL35_12560 [Streptomyces sp. ET3-23]|uniref:hypothetical protein n=1 Tax=Streptomyces sp. ET3-23 TaxID=2885643 RepID=UPI001D0FC4A7|nr:hypothetical protein [Streptomyces sp. ET3-23]MCC2276238.1 hypothetical protein [Streptomyces sp. ET3-23]